MSAALPNVSGDFRVMLQELHFLLLLAIPRGHFVLLPVPLAAYGLDAVCADTGV